MITNGAASASTHREAAAARAKTAATSHVAADSTAWTWVASPTARTPRPRLWFDDATQTAYLGLPTPVCPPGQSDCVWMLYMNEPNVKGHPLVGVVTGTSGTLSLPYPSFCGVLQVDALIGPSPWVYRWGIRHTIATCTPPTTTTTTTTTTTSTSTSTTTTPTTTTTSTTAPTPTTSTLTTTPPTTSTPTTRPAQVAATTATPPSSSALPFSDPASTDPASINPATTAAIKAELPYTGTDVKSLVFLGSLLVIVGGLILTSAESRRRAARRIAGWPR